MSGYHPYKQGESSKSRPDSPTIDDSVPSLKPVQTTKASKRIRGEIACAECRRLKIRCDKMVPCSTCVKRGCTSLCPNGTIPPGQGSRFVLAATDHLHRKLAKFEARMHALEDALAITQANHPLLSSSGKEEDDTDDQALKPVSEDADKTEKSALSDMSGTLYINGNGVNRFFGPSGGPETLLLEVAPREDRLKLFSSPRLPELDNSYLPPEIINFSQSFPLTPPNIPIASTQKSVESFLPPMERAIVLCDTFLEHLSWMFHIVSRQLLVSELIPAIYEGTSDYGPHDLALLLIVLGIGVLVDLTIEPYSLEGQHFYNLARAAMVLQPILTEQSIVTIKVLHLMSIYNGLSGQESNLEQSYALLNLAGQVATKIGFHVDPAMWKFKGREAYDRRVYFWNLMAGVLWTCLVTGRPPVISSDFIACKIPTAEEEAMYQQGEFPLGFGVWGFQVTTDCLLPVVHATLAAKPPSYETVLELDAKIRQAVVLPASDSDPMDDRTALSMRTFVRSHYQHLILLYLHRGFFTQAMTEHPSNPLLSPYRKSVIAAYQSACVVLEDTRVQYQKKPLLCARIWRIWSFAFSAAVIVGTVATRGIHLNLEPPSALEQFESACEVFRGAAETSNRAAKALPVLDAMLKKAVEAARSQRNQLVISMPNEEFLPGSSDNVDRKPVTRLPPTDPESRHLYAPFQQPRSSVPPHQPQPLPKITTVFSPRDGHPVRLDHPHASYSSYPTSARSAESNPPSPAPSIPAPSLPQSAERRSFADLSQGWGGLFHETGGSTGMYASTYHPAEYGHKRAPPSNTAYGNGINDKWSSFMNYNILEERPDYPPPNRLPPQFQR